MPYDFDFGERRRDVQFRSPQRLGNVSEQPLDRIDAYGRQHPVAVGRRVRRVAH
jgi:hypothetical protein